MENNNNKEKKDDDSYWHGKVSSSPIPGVHPDQAWSLLGDFCSLHKFYPPLTTSHHVDGPHNETGCIRYCAAPIGWATQKLVDIDPVGRSYSYTIVENNLGFGNYFATLKVVPAGEVNGCGIEWSFESDPIEGGGFTLSGFISFLQATVEEMSKLVGDALRLRDAACELSSD